MFTQVFFLFESLIAFFALEGFFKLFKKALPALFRRINDSVLLIGIYHDTEHRTFLFIYFE